MSMHVRKVCTDVCAARSSTGMTCDLFGYNQGTYEGTDVGRATELHERRCSVQRRAHR